MFAVAVHSGIALPVTDDKQQKVVPKITPAAVNLNAKRNAHGKATVSKPLLPIGEGAYQSSEAVAQRTLDKNRDCEKGKWNGCLHNDKADIVDGHSYGNLRGESAAVEAPAPPPKPVV